jgi:hypothetical protein
MAVLEEMEFSVGESCGFSSSSRADDLSDIGEFRLEKT